MRRLVVISSLLLVLQLRLAPAQIIPTTEETGPRVITFMDLWTKSTCQPMEQLVDVEQEFPGEVEYIYFPSCVPLHRCSGCCSDERHECQPTLERNVTMEIRRITPATSSTQVTLTFVEHQMCECRLRRKLQKSNSQSMKTKPPKKTKMRTNGCGKCQFPPDKLSLH